MNYPECKNNYINLEELGANRPLTIEDLVNEVIRNRRKRFFDELTSLKDGEESHNYCFDAIAFNSAVDDFEESFDSNPRHKNYEGTMEYSIIAGDDWIWHCKTTITWCSALPRAFGELKYHTEILSTSGVKSRINGMTGTAMKMVMKENHLKSITIDEVLRRDTELLKG